MPFVFPPHTFFGFTELFHIVQTSLLLIKLDELLARGSASLPNALWVPSPIIDGLDIGLAKMVPAWLGARHLLNCTHILLDCSCNWIVSVPNCLSQPFASPVTILFLFTDHFLQ